MCSREVIVPIPLFSTPIESSNPVFIVNTSKCIDFEIDFINEPRVVVYLDKVHEYSDEDYRRTLIEYLTKFFQTIVAKVLGNKGVRLTIDKAFPYNLLVYVFITQKAIEYMGLDSREAFEVANSIDRVIGIRDSIIPGLRKALLLGKNLVYRNEEEHVVLPDDLGLEIDVREHMRFSREEVLSIVNESAIRSSIIHLSGYAVIELTRCILSHGFRECISVFYDTVRIFNGLYYIVYNIYPRTYGVYVRDLGDYVSIATVSGVEIV